MNDFIKQNPLLVGALGLGVVAFLYYKNSDLFLTVKEKAATLGQGLQNPVDALLANFGVGLDYVGGTRLTPNFQEYINDHGGVDAYLKAQRSGTFTGAPYDPNKYRTPTILPFSRTKVINQQPGLSPFYF